MADILRKAQTGEPTVNGGQFASQQRTEADAGVLEPADTVETAIESVDRVHSEIEAKRKELARLAADALSRTFAADVPDAVSLIVVKSLAALQDAPTLFQAVDADGRTVLEGWVKDGNWRRIGRLVEMLDNDLGVLEYVKDTRDVTHEPGARYWALALDRGRVDATRFVDGFVETTAAEVTGRQARTLERLVGQMPVKPTATTYPCGDTDLVYDLAPGAVDRHHVRFTLNPAGQIISAGEGDSRGTSCLDDNPDQDDFLRLVAAGFGKQPS